MELKISHGLILIGRGGGGQAPPSPPPPPHQYASARLGIRLWLWNMLPQEVISCTNLEGFKQKVQNIQLR